MTESDKILAQIGEFVYTEMGEVKSITYAKDGTSFTVIFDDGKEFIVEVLQKILC